MALNHTGFVGQEFSQFSPLLDSSTSNKIFYRQCDEPAEQRPLPFRPTGLESKEFTRLAGRFEHFVSTRDVHFNCNSLLLVLCAKPSHIKHHFTKRRYVNRELINKVRIMKRSQATSHSTVTRAKVKGAI